MICRERKEDWMMFEQHQHGLLAGEFAKALDSASFRNSKRWNEIVYAVKEHDRGWIDLDDNPFLNDALQEPYTFIDFPIAVKLAFYTKGLNEIELQSPYASLLCSMHFDRLLEQAKIDHPTLTKYMQQEQSRRDRIRKQLSITGVEAESELIYDLHILQFCDDLSLYLCLNEPGVEKNHEFPWWRDGFEGSEIFDCTGGEIIQSYWKDSQTVVLTPYPFDHVLTIELPYRVVSKGDIQEKGITEAFSNSELKHYSFQIQSR